MAHGLADSRRELAERLEAEEHNRRADGGDAGRPRGAPLGAGLARGHRRARLPRLARPPAVRPARDAGGLVAGRRLLRLSVTTCRVPGTRSDAVRGHRRARGRGLRRRRRRASRRPTADAAPHGPQSTAPAPATGYGRGRRPAPRPRPGRRRLRAAPRRRARPHRAAAPQAVARPRLPHGRLRELVVRGQAQLRLALRISSPCPGAAAGWRWRSRGARWTMRGVGRRPDARQGAGHRGHPQGQRLGARSPHPGAAASGSGSARPARGAR